MKIRIEKLICDLFPYSRSEVKKLISAKRISVNGEILKKAINVDPEIDEIYLDDMIIKNNEETIYMLNKPSGYLTANFDNFKPTVFDLVDLDARKYFAFGRLDFDTEGILLIGKDGKLAHQLLSLKHHVAKTYYLEAKNAFSEKLKNHYPKPIDIGEGDIIKDYKFEFIDDNKAYLTIYQGKYHQIKRMITAFDNEVIYLKRISFGPINLDENLALGEWRSLTKQEIQALYDEIAK
ncbi:rRNA pseudouridine synthase [[Mycoplasma] falconis]|uniref:rRNA pseudouridine synthase n=1 Tax=[Mycoplasma] falconis TaxID=92403 RepID=A0A501X998_9BACT|nr:pseudouridine synthase [[Mycoplasma] falconis]TPE57148.1 rRNA pseudouridine synthase [[Mycoplasma] falconis]